eukprot:gene7346-5180_t
MLKFSVLLMLQGHNFLVFLSIIIIRFCCFGSFFSHIKVGVPHAACPIQTLHPKIWYQAIGVGGIAFLVYLRHNPIVAWLVSNLHFSFGTQYLWYKAYQIHLENMSFNERLGFTFYGVALAGLSFTLFHFFIWRCQTFARGELFPDKTVQNNAWFLLFCAIETARLRQIISACFEEQGSPAYYALRQLQKSPVSEVESISILFNNTSANPHFVIQRSVLDGLTRTFLARHVPIFLISGVYRLTQDVPRKIYVSLRWYMATFSCSYAIVKVGLAFVSGEWNDSILWISIASTVLYMGIVNYTYGPSKRAGMTKATSYARCVKMACVGLSLCLLMWVVSLLTMLAVCVSVHVFELILIWLGIFLTIVWVPAVVDSFAISFIVVMTGVAAYIGYGMEVLSQFGVMRFWLYITLLWINVCLIYNFLLNLLYSRYAALGALTILLGIAASVSLLNPVYMKIDMYQLRKDAEWHDQSLAERYVLHLLLWVATMCEFKPNFDPPQDFMVWIISHFQLSDNAAIQAYLGFVFFNVLVALSLVMSIKALHCCLRSPAREKELRRRGIITVTPIVCAFHLARGLATLVVALIFIAFYTTMKDVLLPRYSMLNALPNILHQMIAFTAACLALGFLDCGEVLYDTFTRAMALQDPPDEHTENATNPRDNT